MKIIIIIIIVFNHGDLYYLGYKKIIIIIIIYSIVVTFSSKSACSYSDITLFSSTRRYPPNTKSLRRHSSKKQPGFNSF